MKSQAQRYDHFTLAIILAANKSWLFNLASVARCRLQCHRRRRTAWKLQHANTSHLYCH